MPIGKNNEKVLLEALFYSHKKTNKTIKKRINLSHKSFNNYYPECETMIFSVIAILMHHAITHRTSNYSD